MWYNMKMVFFKELKSTQVAARMNKTSIGIVIAVLFGFCLILWAADSVGASFGKIGENIALGIIAAILVVGLIRARKEK